MNKLEKAARQLLEVAEGIQYGSDWNNGTHANIYRPKFPAAITALREALAEQAEQEPVAVVDPFYIRQLDDELELGTKLYAAPVRTKDLTDEEIDLIDALNWEKDNKVWGIREFARAVIAADREKNRG